MKTVAIVGGGPAGLVTAKVLLRSKNASYNVRIFEKANSVGGLWAVDKEKPYDGMLNPDMPTNISRFNFCFSDLSWQSVGIPGHVPYFPKAWMGGRYLQEYSTRFIPQDSISLGTRVTKVRKASEGEVMSKTAKWHLAWVQTDADGSVRTGEDVFDYLVMAAGFFPQSFSTPTSIPANIIPQVHSTKVRSLTDLASADKSSSGTILIVGGGMSGADVATNLAAERSNAIHEPCSDGKAYENLKLVQIVPKPFYALPLMVPRVTDDPELKAPEFTTLDLALYDLGRRPSGDIELGIGKLSHVFIKKSHAMLRGIVGGDQREFGQPGMPYENEKGVTTFVAITEQYAEYLRAGDISLVAGRFSGLELRSGSNKVVASVTQNGKTRTIEDVIGVVYATGFTPHGAVTILSEDVKHQLEYDPENNRLPLILDMDRFYTGREELPDLAFIGYHEGQSWPGMEMQARYVESRWSSGSLYPDGTSISREESRQLLREIGKSMKAAEPELPMYFLGDYTGLMESIARKVGIRRHDFDWQQRTGPVTAGRYAADPNDLESKRMLEELQIVMRQSRETARFVARAAFRAMHGTWKISRQLNSFLAGFPSGTLEGTASFHPRYTTDSSYDAEYLYIEQGTFKNDQGLSFTASRRYVYRYQESVDKITVWFVKDDGKTVDYFFHDLAFDPSSREEGWVANADHLCVKDQYTSTYLFGFRGANVPQLKVVHAVKGPQKNYVSTTTYVRGAPGTKYSNQRA